MLFGEKSYTCNKDIILASETWLHPGIHDCEVLPDNYRFIARRDRPSDPHGGVAVIAHRELEGVQVNLPTDSEFVAASFTCKHSKKPLITGALYRPPSSDADYMDSLCSATSRLSNMYPSSVIWISGDANLPDIEWETMSITGHQNPVPVNSQFMNTVMDVARSLTSRRVGKISSTFSSLTDRRCSTSAHRFLASVIMTLYS